MEHITVETTGDFMLLDRYSGAEIPSRGSVTVPHTPFVKERLENGDLRKTDDPVEALFGSDVLSSLVDVGAAEPLPLGDIVRRAFDASGLTVSEWNALDAAERDARLQSVVDQLTDEHTAPPAEAPPVETQPRGRRGN